MKKTISLILVFLVLLACDLSSSIVPTEQPDDMAATVNSIMTDFPTIESLPTKKPTSQPTLLAPIPSGQATFSGSMLPTGSAGTPQLTFQLMAPPHHQELNTHPPLPRSPQLSFQTTLATAWDLIAGWTPMRMVTIGHRAATNSPALCSRMER